MKTSDQYRLFAAVLLGLLFIEPVFAQHFMPFVSNRPATLPTPIPSRSRSFSIPFEVRPDNSADPAKEVELMVSRDQGVRWHSGGRQPIEAKKFDFKADDDGEFWFAFRTLTLSGATRQAGAGPQIRVLVDSVAPKLSLEMKQQPSGEMLVHWKAEDRNLAGKRPDFSVAAIVYAEATDAEKKWIPLNVDGKHFRFSEVGSEGNFLFWPENGVTELELRAAVTDAAGNGSEKTCSATIKAVQRDEATRFQDALKAGEEKPMAPDGKVEHFTPNEAPPAPLAQRPSGSGVRLEPPKPVRMKKETRNQTATPHAVEAAETIPVLPETVDRPPNPPKETAETAEKEAPTDGLTERLVAGMERFFEQGLSVEIAPKTEKKAETISPNNAPRLPAVIPARKPESTTATPTGKTASMAPAAPAPAAVPERPSPKYPGKISGVSLNTTATQPQIIIKWEIGDGAWRDAQVDIFRCAEMSETATPSPWFPIATNLPNSGEYWWYLSNDDFRPFRIMVQIRAPQGGVHLDSTKSAIRINPKNVAR